MLIKCPNCHSKARIGSSNELTPTIRELYCQCSNAKDCGATFVYTLGLKHYLNPPINNTQQLAASLLRHLPNEQRRALLQADLFG
ncbi:MAG: ogr/Delta-like zinc finger family protein [Methylobacter sp.]